MLLVQAGAMFRKLAKRASELGLGPKRKAGAAWLRGGLACEFSKIRHVRGSTNFASDDEQNIGDHWHFVQGTI